MPPKRSATVPPLAPIEPDNRPDSPADAEQAPVPMLTREEYDALVNGYRETLQRIQELGEAFQAAHRSSSHTSPGPGEQARDPTPLSGSEGAHHALPREPKVALAPEFSGKISEFSNFMAACSVVFTLCPNTYVCIFQQFFYTNVIWSDRGSVL